MSKKFELYDYFFLFILTVNIYSVSILLGSGFIGYILNLLHFVIFVSFIVYKFDFHKFFRFHFERINIVLLEIYLLVTVFVFSSYYVNLEYNMDISTFLKLLSYPIIFFLFFIQFSKKLYEDDNFFEKFLIILLYLGIIHAIYSIIANYLGLNINSKYSASITGIFEHPNTTSFIYTILIPILLYKYFSKQIGKVFFVSVLILFIYCLLYTFSRNGYLSFFIIVLLYSYSKSKITFFIALILSIGILFSIFFDFAFSKADSTITRTLLYYTSIDMITRDMNHFLWGYGVKNAIDVFINDKVIFGSFEQVISTHNFILQLAIQFGVILPVIFCILIFNIYINVYLIKKSHLLSDRYFKFSFCLIITFGLLVQNMLEDTLAHPGNFVLPFFLMFLGYLYNGWKEYKHIKNPINI